MFTHRTHDLPLLPMPGTAPIRLVSVQVGTPRTVGSAGAPDPMERVFTSAIWKAAVSGRVHVGRLGLEGDAVANRRYHGGPDQAVLAYASEHYARWAEEWQQSEMPGGSFGENFTVTGVTEETICIGDLLAVGGARLQVSQPRQPCATLARRHQRADLVRTVAANGRSGWYLRVLEEGEVGANDALVIVDRPCPEWSVARASRVWLERARLPEDAAELARCSGLSASWRTKLAPG
jgi:MOSC domain-containing protein YiiM